mmetsp:Transcript_14931/g.23947  ORF Transcript_14931/g.23947 Transcript_14931/m.23947 type:complete len:83 (+) Transcript_14931:51-299(+)
MKSDSGYLCYLLESSVKNAACISSFGLLSAVAVQSNATLELPVRFRLAEENRKPKKNMMRGCAPRRWQSALLQVCVVAFCGK